MFVSTETSWQTVSEAINGIDPSVKETAFTKLERLIDVSAFKEGLNAEQQETFLQTVGLTGWKDQVLEAIDEVRLVCVYFHEFTTFTSGSRVARSVQYTVEGC